MKPYQSVQESTLSEQDITTPKATSDPPASPPRVAAPTQPRASQPSRYVIVKPPARFADFVVKVCVSIQKVNGLVNELKHGW